MKHIAMILAAVLMLVPVWALADGPVLLVELPEDAQMVENVEFEDGDFIQTYQLSGNGMVYLLRYGNFDMTLGELVQSEWTGCTDLREIEVKEIGGFPAEGLSLSYQEESYAVKVSIMLVEVGDATLMAQIVFPAELGDAQIEALVDGMIGSMDVLSGSAEEAEVG